MRKLRIEFYRNKQRLTQQQLADAVGVSVWEIVAYERGVESPTLDTAIKIAETLGVSLAELVKEGE